MNYTPLTYSQNFNQSKGFLLQSNDILQKILAENESIIVQGSLQSNFCIATQQQTYSLQLTKTRNTMLITPMFGGKVIHQLSDIMVFQKCLPKYHQIYLGLLQKVVNQTEYLSKPFLQIFNEYSFQLQQILNYYKVSKKQLLNFIKYTNCILINGRWLSISNSLIDTLMRNLILELNHLNKISQPFYFEQISINTKIASPQIMDLLVKKLKINKLQNQYQITLQSIIRFVLINLAIAKTIYMKNQFDHLLKEALTIYFPIGTQIPIKIPEISQYFIFIPKNNHMNYYDPLLIQASVRQRLKFMQKYKTRFSYNQIYGLFLGMAEDFNIEEVILKHFRKYGEEYEIKLLIGKKSMI